MSVVGLPAAGGRTAGGLDEHAAQSQDRLTADRPPGGVPVTPPDPYHFDTRVNDTALITPRMRPIDANPGAFLCDRITIIFPVILPSGVRPDIGLMWFVDGQGTVESFRHRRQMVEGSWSSKVSVEVHSAPIFDAALARSAHDSGLDLVWLRVDGNPVKYFQGWNLFGSPDVRSLAGRLVEAVLALIGLGPESGAVPHLDNGYFNRIDATYNFDLGTVAAASSLVSQLGKLASVVHRRSSAFSGSMLFPGRGSSLCIYHKGPEMRAHPPKRDIPGLVEYADRIVRFEVVSRSERLDLMGLRRVKMWTGINSSKHLFDLWLSFCVKLRFPVMGHVDLSALSKPACRLYSVWLTGEDVSAFASRMTVYRHRLAILQAGGPDIVLPKPGGDVIEFRRVLRPVAAAVPAEFAALLFHPFAA